MAKKPSFFDRLTGSTYDSDYTTYESPAPTVNSYTYQPPAQHMIMQQEPQEAQLTVDMLQTPSEIIIRALVAGVKPDDLDISIGRDMVTIKGRRFEDTRVDGNGYIYQELYWGGFSRSIVLPAEIDVDAAEAEQKHGLLTITLPKVNKDRQTKLRVRG